LSAAEDTYTSQGNPGAVHGTYSHLGVNATPGERRAYVKFTVSSIPAGSTQVTAVLRLWPRASLAATFTAWRVPSGWTESTLTWANQPPLDAAVTVQSGVVGGQYNTLDVSSFVTGNGTYALAITGGAATLINFSSKEATDNHPPQLSLGWAPTVVGDAVVGAPEDIACAPGTTSGSTFCQRAAAAALVAMQPTAVLDLGDNQYESGTLAEFQGSYATSWGQLNGVVHPAAGNHEYGTAGAGGYYTSFGTAAHPRQPGCTNGCDGYYSFDLGAWHLVALNAQCAAVGGCGAGSPQEVWLRKDLDAHPNLCTLAYWHQPRFSSGSVVGSNATYATFWQDLYDAGVELVLNGHAHSYERFAPQTPTGAPDPAGGVRELVVGTGGRSLQSFGTLLANSEAHDATTFGVVELALHATGYGWRFVAAAGGGFAESGSGSCHGRRDTQPPTAPTSLTATPVSGAEVDLTWGASTDNLAVTGYNVYRDGVRVGSTSGATSYQDKSLASSSSYAFQVTAVDAAGDQSAKSSTAHAATRSSGGGGSVLTFGPTDDATIVQAAPTANDSGSASLIVDNSPVDQALPRFEAATNGCAIQRAALKLTDSNDARQRRHLRRHRPALGRGDGELGHRPRRRRNRRFARAGRQRHHLLGRLEQHGPRGWPAQPAGGDHVRGRRPLLRQGGLQQPDTQAHGHLRMRIRPCPVAAGSPSRHRPAAAVPPSRTGAETREAAGTPGPDPAATVHPRIREAPCLVGAYSPLSPPSSWRWPPSCRPAGSGRQPPAPSRRSSAPAALATDPWTTRSSGPASPVHPTATTSSATPAPARSRR
jgi:hypothetical protein